MASHIFYSPPVAPDGTAANHTATKGQVDVLIADAKNLANATGTLAAARIADGSLGTVKISGFQAAVDARVAALTDASSTALDTFREVATAINNDPNFTGTITGLITAVSSRVTTLEQATPPATAPLSFTLPAIVANTPVSVTHGKGRRVMVQVTEVSTGQIVNPVIAGNGATSNTVTIDFGSLASAAGTFVALVL